MTRALRRALFLLGSLAALASPIDAQVCRGVASESPVWFAMQYGRAAKHASVHGADISWQLDQGLLLFTDANVTMYPQPDPARGRVAVGMGIEVGEFRGVGVCTTFGFERERIGDLQVQRIPIGIALGWSRPLAGVARRIGFTVEPFYVHGTSGSSASATRRTSYQAAPG